MSSLVSGLSFLPSMSTPQSLRQSQRSSLSASHKIGRNLAKLAVDAFCLSKGEDCETSQGDIFNTIPDGGSNWYSSLCDDEGLVLVKINYCQRALQGKFDQAVLSKESGESIVSQEQVESINQMTSRSIINHDYLVLVLQRGSGEELYILAHKLAKGGKQEKAGIFISAIDKEEVRNDLNDGVKLYEIGCGVNILLESLIEVLEDDDPNYNVRDKNCWDYVTKTAKSLISKCAQIAGTNPELRATLKKESRELLANIAKNHIFNTAAKVLEMISS